MLMIMEGFEVSMRSRMLPKAIRVGSFTMFCSPKSLVISSSLLCLLAVLLLVVWFDSTAMDSTAMDIPVLSDGGRKKYVA